MFLRKTIEENKQLINVVSKFHQDGLLNPDTYVIDYDTTMNNAKIILEEANKKNIELYFMLKQVGRNPLLAKGFMELGYKGAVVVDFREAETMMDLNIPLGNVGHLVQTPKNILRKVIEYGTEVFTVFTYEKLQEINEISKDLNTNQDVILKVYSDGDMQYPGQEGGVKLEDLESFLEKSKNLSHISIVGATAFPAFLYNHKIDEIEETHNYKTIMNAVDIMKSFGCEIKQINAPSTTSVATLKLMENTNVTHGEPGHGLTGSTPAHAYSKMIEIPSVVYLSEISHTFENRSYAYGGGHYRRSHVKEALNISNGVEKIAKVSPIEPENIDYYFQINENLDISSTVIMAFRFQIFVTRSHVAVLKGVHSNAPKIMGVYDALGKKVN